MPRGRHRQAPPLHRLLVPAAVVVFALLCAAGSLLVSGTTELRVLTLLVAVAAVTGAVLLRSWDRAAGRAVGEIRAAKANAEWQADERAAEFEADLHESREMRGKLERRLRSRRAELAKLRTEHAALLRRYATAETERANALEGRRKLAIAAAEPVKALTTGAADHRRPSGAPTALTYLQADQALANLMRAASKQRERAERELAVEQQPAAGERLNLDEPASAAPGSREEDGGSTSGFSFFGQTPVRRSQTERAPQDSPTSQPPTAPQRPADPQFPSDGKPMDGSWSRPGPPPVRDAEPGHQSAGDSAAAETPQQDSVRPHRVASKVIDVSE